MSTQIIYALLIAFIAVFITMSLTWHLQKFLTNAGIVDVTWSYNFLIIALVYFTMLEGNSDRKILITSMAIAWSFRLGTYLLIRVGGHLEKEDGRYLQLRKDWAANLQRKFFLFFQFQGILNILLSLPFLIICLNTAPAIAPIEWFGLTVYIIALLGESISDWQLKNFKANAANKGKVCNTGLWRYSRHPNYFFEWCIWVAFFLTALGSPYGWITIICPAMMLHFLYRVTGIPMTEEQSIRTKGDAYKEYQKTTNAFIPWFTKKRTTI